MFVILILGVIILAVIFKVYLKLTTGLCKSSRHLVGKVVIVTGGNTGLGYETALDLANRGARVIIACRSQSKGISARDSIVASTGNHDVHCQQLDLASLASVRAFADNIIKSEKHLDILINNAGLFESENVNTEDGLLLAMQSNHFGPFLLTSLLLPLLKSSAPSRIINVSSLYHFMGKVDFDNLNYEKGNNADYDYLQIYKNTKVCNILMTLELVRRLEGTRVTANSLHPGAVATDIIKSEKSWSRRIRTITNVFRKTPWEGAQTTIYAAVTPELENVTGKYFADCKEARTSKLAKDKDVARKLWDVSEKLVGLK